jgi:acetate---CoA ligase (ADP-forming)
MSESPGTAVRDLDAFFDPRAIAVVGASNDPAKWGYWLAAGALRGEHRRSVYLVNQRGGPVLDRASYTNIAELPDGPDLVVVAVPLAAMEGTIDDALARGTRAIVAVNAGFAETGEAGRKRQDDLVQQIRSAGAALIGPNCLGITDSTTDLQVAWLSVGEEGLPPGPIGLISQSGGIAMDIAMHCAATGLGVSRFASVGNQADVTVTDLVRSYAAHEATRMIALYCEDFGDGRAFAQAVGDAVSAGKPVALIAAGGGGSSARAAQSHTGAMSSDDRIVEAVCRATGAVKVATPAELVDVAHVLLRSARPRGRRVGIVSDGGGHAVVATGVATAAGFRVEAFTDALSRRLTEETDPTAATGNPVDLASSNLDPSAFERVITTIAESGEVDAILMTGIFGGLDQSEALLARETEAGRNIAATAAAHGLTLVAQSMAFDSPPVVALRDAGGAVFRDLDRAIRALARVADAAGLEPVEATGDVAGAHDLQPAGDYFAARALVEGAGIAFPPAEAVDTADEAVAAAARIGYPVALKAVALLHKSDAGGVALNLEHEAGLRAAFEAMQASIPARPYSVEGMVNAPHGVELVVGCRRDPRFGVVLLVGIGGIYTEILRDVVVCLAPASQAEVLRSLRALNGFALLRGARGKPPVDLEAVARAASALSEVAARDESIEEIEINPLLAHPDGATALDVRVVAGRKGP